SGSYRGSRRGLTGDAAAASGLNINSPKRLPPQQQARSAAPAAFTITPSSTSHQSVKQQATAAGTRYTSLSPSSSSAAALTPLPKSPSPSSSLSSLASSPITSVISSSS